MIPPKIIPSSSVRPFGASLCITVTLYHLALNDSRHLFHGFLGKKMALDKICVCSFAPETCNGFWIVMLREHDDGHVSRARGSQLMNHLGRIVFMQSDIKNHGIHLLVQTTLRMIERLYHRRLKVLLFALTRDKSRKKRIGVNDAHVAFHRCSWHR